MESPHNETNVSQIIGDDLDIEQQELSDEWDHATVKVLLRCIIEKDFYPQLISLEYSQRTDHWMGLHKYFCEQPEVVQYAATPAGQNFGEKYKRMEYVQEKFQILEGEFRYVASDIMRTGSRSAASAAKHPHYEDLKNITFGDPTFWPPYIFESSCVKDGALSGPVTYQRREDGVSYNVTHTPTRPEWTTYVQDLTAQLLAAQAAGEYGN